MNRLHGLVKLYSAANSLPMSSNQSKEQATSTASTNAPDRTRRSYLRSTMATNHDVLFTFVTLIIFYSATLCHSQSTLPVVAPKPIPYGTVLTPRNSLEALAPYSTVSRKPSFQSAITPSSVVSAQQPLAAESSNIVHKFKFAFHNRPHGQLIEDDDELLDERPVNLVRNSRQYESALPYSSGRVHHYLPGSTSAIYVDSSEELVDDFESAQQPQAQSRRNMAREKHIVADPNSDQSNANNHTFKNFFIPLPTHRLNDRSLATGVIVISQDNGFPSFRNSDDNGRQFHYELLSIPQKDKQVNSNTMIKETKSSNSSENRSNESLEFVSEEEPEEENGSTEKNTETEKREIDRVFVPENDHGSRKKINDKLAALTITMENKRNLEPPRPSQSPPTDFIASSLKARIHLSRPSTNSFNINLVKTISGEQMNNETQGSVEEVTESDSKLNDQRVDNSNAKDGPSLLLLVERETMLNKIRKNVKKASRKVTEGDSISNLTTEANVVVRPRRRQSKLSLSAINLNTALNKSNFVLKQRKNDKLMRLNMTISENRNSTERPTELTTTSILNSLVKELNLALKDRLRQLESFNQTMTSTAATTTIEVNSTETTTVLPSTTTDIPETKTTTTEANSSENESTADARNSDDSAEIASTTTISPATDSASNKRSAISSKEDASEEVTSIVSTEAVVTTTTLPELTTTDSSTTSRNSAEDSSEEVNPTTTSITSMASSVTSSEEMTSSEEVSEETNNSTQAGTTTAQTTTMTTTVPTTTTTKSTTKRESRKKQKGSSTPIASILIKKSKKSSQLKSASHLPAKSSSKAISKSSLKTSITVKSADIGKSNDTEEFKLKMNVTLPKSKNAEEPLKRVRSVSTTAKPKMEANKPLRFSFDISSSPIKKNKLESTTQATTKWNQDPSRQLVWSLWNPSTTAKPATTKRVAMPVEEIVIFERRPPGPPKIPNNFGFANTIRDSEHIFDDESNDEVDEARQELPKQLSVSEPKSRLVVEEPVNSRSASFPKEQPKKIERERDFEDDDSESDDDEDDLADTNVPGTPGVDYPVLGHIPDTTFDCSKQKYPGFYSDMNMGCQVYHSCSLASIAQPESAVDQIGASSSISTQSSGEYPFLVAESSPMRRIQSSRKSGLNGGKHSFLCPNGTIFSQEYLICDWWYNVKCDESPRFYPLNRDVFTSGQQNSNHYSQTMALASASSPVADTVIPGEFHTVHYHDRISAPRRDSKIV